MDAIAKYEILNGIVLPSQRPVARTVRAILTRDEVELLEHGKAELLKKSKRSNSKRGGKSGSILVF